MKLGVVDVGGGLRGVYAAGVLDYCMENGIVFDVGIGVSAGSANISSYMANQKNRAYRFYMDYSFRKEYMSVGNFLKRGSYINMDYLYGTLCNADGEDPLGYEAIARSPMEFKIVATNAETGQVKYFDKSDISQDGYDVFKASCSIPLVCKPYVIDGVPYYDGALSDPVPIEKAFSMGCDKVVLILTKPKDILRTPDTDKKLASGIKKKYPQAAEAISRRAEKYNADVEKAKEYEREGKLLIIAPDDTCGLDTLKRDKTAIQKMYDKGFSDAIAIKEFISAK